MRRILFLTKVMEKREYAEQFLAGHLYMNPLSYFQSIEEDVDGRGDSFEGCAALFQPNQCILTIGDLEIEASSLVGPIRYAYQKTQNANVMCMYAGYLDESDTIVFDNNQILTADDQRDTILNALIPDENLDDLGEWSVTIRNIPEFKKRFTAAAREAKLTSATGLVKYYDPNTFHGSFPEGEEMFYKRNTYAYQKEFRLAVIRNDGKPFVLSIGDISDIAELLPTRTTFESIDVHSANNSV